PPSARRPGDAPRGACRRRGQGNHQERGRGGARTREPNSPHARAGRLHAPACGGGPVTLACRGGRNRGGSMRPWEICLPSRGVSPQGALHLACVLEDLGYGGLWATEVAGHDAVALLAAIATQTARLRLGTAHLPLA